MSQRNPMNERYNDENRTGKTRKSAASAKPSSARAATVRTPAPKSKKQKQKEAREKEREREQRMNIPAADGKRFEDTDEYKKWRRLWWVCIVAAIVLIALSFASTQNEQIGFLYIPGLVAGYALVIAAFVIDLGKIRKLRKEFTQTVALGKSKEARAAQKKARAEARAQQKEAEEKFEAAKAEEESKKANGLLARFRKPKADAVKSENENEGAEEPSN